MSEKCYEHRIVTFSDPQGRTLPCCVHASFEHDGHEVVLLHPVHAPIEVFGLEFDEDDQEILVGVEDEEVDAVLAAAQSELAKQGLAIELSALVPTVSGEVPACTEEDVISVATGEEEAPDGESTDGESAEYQVLAVFERAGQDYVVCTPLSKMLFIARLNAEGQAELLPDEELDAVREQLEHVLSHGGHAQA